MDEDTNNLVDVRLIQWRVGSLARQLGQRDFAINTRPWGDGSPHIEVADTYHFIVEERGVELERRRTSDLDELLYWILQGLTSRLSWDHERRNRRVNEDSRRQAFAKEVELMSQLSPTWGERLKAEQAKILAVHPFHDA